MISITLETSCLDFDKPELGELELLAKNKKVELWVEEVSKQEKEKWENKKKDKILQWIDNNTKINPITHMEIRTEIDFKNCIKHCIDFSKIYIKVAGIHSQEHKDQKKFRKLKFNNEENLRADWYICTMHILKGRDYFVTLDKKGFIGYDKQEKFEKTFDTKFRLLDNNFINELKELVKC